MNTNDNRLFYLLLALLGALCVLVLIYLHHADEPPSRAAAANTVESDKIAARSCPEWKSESLSPMVAAARKYLGGEYGFGGREPRRLDCMGLVFLAWADSTKADWRKLSVKGTEIIKEKQLGSAVLGLDGVLCEQANLCLLKPGDIVFLLGLPENPNESHLTTINGQDYWIWHMGIYTERGRWISADPAAGKVIEVDFRDYLQRNAELYPGLWVVRPGDFETAAEDPDPGTCPASLPLAQWYARTAAELASDHPLVITQYVALCDNEHQNIAPVSKRLGDGDNPDTNLYWGAAFGYRTFFKKQRAWKHDITIYGETKISETLVFSRTIQPDGAWIKSGLEKPFKVYLVIIGYRGRYIQETVEEYFNALYGEADYPLQLPDGKIVHGGGKSHVVSYAGHDYIMDLDDMGESLINKYRTGQTRAKATMSLCCYSRFHFAPGICSPNNSILLLTESLMAPEAYTAGALYDGLLKGLDQKAIFRKGIEAYAKYQRISVGTAKRMFVLDPGKIGDH